MANLAIENFTFEAQPQALDDLRQRLRRTIWPDEVAAEPWRYGPRGGHFAAWEQPELLARDIRDLFRPLRPLMS